MAEVAEDMEKRLMRLKKYDLKEEARKRRLPEAGTKADLVLKLQKNPSNWIVADFNLHARIM